MKKLITTNISGATKAPFTKPALDNLQGNFSEIPASIIKALLGTYVTNDVIILEGFVITLSNSNNTATWTAGSVYYNGEVYQVSSGTLTKSSGVFLYSIIDSITNATFSDGTNNPWIEVRTITITSGTSGTGIADYGAVTVLPLYPVQEAWRFVGTSGQPAYQNSWATGPITSNVAFRKTPQGKVEFKGLAARTSTISSTSTIFTLPSGYRPSSNGASFSVYTINDFTNVRTSLCLEIDPSTGTVTLEPGSTATDEIGFEGLSFYL
jgi:hypothetical protein